MSDDYIFSRMNLVDAEFHAVSALLRHVFPRAIHLIPDYLRWQYSDNPDGEAIAYNATLDGAVVGHCAALPLTAHVHGKVRKGVMLVNTGVDPAHFRRNITRRTSDPIFEEALRQDYEFAVAVGNRYSTRPLLTRFRMVGPLDARIGFGNPRRVSGGRDKSFERIWSDEAFRWRLANPTRRYLVEQVGQGLRVTCPTEYRAVHATLYEGEPARGVDEASEQQGSRLRVWIGRDPSVRWSRSTYLPIPTSLRPSPLNFVFKDLRGGELHPDADGVLFRGLDFDAY